MQRAGLWRIPLVTAVVFGVTAAGAIAQAVVPGLLVALERAPAGLRGEWWRPVTALVVLAVPAIVVGAIATGLTSAAVGRGVALGRPVTVVVLACGVALAALTNVHGAALLIGLVLALPYRKAAIPARS